MTAACLLDCWSSISWMLSFHCQNIRLLLHCLHTQKITDAYNSEFDCSVQNVLSKKCRSDQTNNNRRIHLHIWWNGLFRSLKKWTVGDSVVVIFSVLASAHCHHPRLCTWISTHHSSRHFFSVNLSLIICYDIFVLTLHAFLDSIVVLLLEPR